MQCHVLLQFLLTIHRYRSSQPVTLVVVTDPSLAIGSDLDNFFLTIFYNADFVKLLFLSRQKSNKRGESKYRTFIVLQSNDSFEKKNKWVTIPMYSSTMLAYVIQKLIKILMVLCAVERQFEAISLCACFKINLTLHLLSFIGVTKWTFISVDFKLL